MFFFFSSRRRHTRLQGDWSSDVCSSDLFVAGGIAPPRPEQAEADERLHRHATTSLGNAALRWRDGPFGTGMAAGLDRKSTRLNSSHLVISYAVFCLKKKKSVTDRGVLPL